MQERIVREDGSMGEWGVPADGADYFAPFRGKTVTESEAARTAMVETLPDGSVKYNCVLPDNLLSHFRGALIEGNYRAIYEQLVSEEAKANYVNRGRNPESMINWFEENRRELLVLLNRMSLGAMSPNSTFRQSGNYFTISLVPQVAKDQVFSQIEMTRENRQFRLLVIQ